MRLLTFTLLLLFISGLCGIDLMPATECICGAAFEGSTRALTTHQNKCSIYNGTDVAATGQDRRIREIRAGDARIVHDGYNRRAQDVTRQQETSANARRARLNMPALHTTLTGPSTVHQQPFPRAPPNVPHHNAPPSSARLPHFEEEQQPPFYEESGHDDTMDIQEPPEHRRPLPRRVQDILPEGLAPFHDTVPRVRLLVRDTIQTIGNVFGLFRQYPHRPSYDPEAIVQPEDLLNPSESSTTSSIPPEIAPPWPFDNMTRYNLMAWANNSNPLKSAGEIDALVNDVLLPTADTLKADLEGFRMATETKKMDKAAEAASNPLLQSFTEVQVDIDIPSGESGKPSTKAHIPGLHYRKITDVIRTAFAGNLARHFHLYPYKLMHKAGEKVQRIFNEIYTSDAFIKAHDDLQFRSRPPGDNPGCKLERVVAALMFFSDATHLTNFGTAKAWPIYLTFGNLSKYTRSRPSSGALHHLAYIPSLPDAFQDLAAKVHAKWKTQKSDILAHSRRDLMHAVWEILLGDPEFVQAYVHGMVIVCADGVTRRVYPRIFTYSADYPEKVLLATIRDKGLCPCPRCLTPKANIDRMGQKLDTRFRLGKYVRKYLGSLVTIARDQIYRVGRAIGGSTIDKLLKPTSSVPTHNAFVHVLGNAFDPFKMLVVDFLHEFELGVWKALFTHLIRVLYAAAPNGDFVRKLNERFRAIGTFGRGTIRKFSMNVSEMKKLAARDFEDILQCSIPVFEGLLPEPFNSLVLTMLYRVAEWHTLAKLRMHSEDTLDIFETATSTLGHVLREFRDKICPHFITVELPKEAAARDRAAQRHAEQQGTKAPPAGTSSRREKTFNLFTYKFHSLGDYFSTIRYFGTTDSYSTQMGELAHRLVKALYGLTNKNDAIKQIAKKYARMRLFKDSIKIDVEALLNVMNEHHYIARSLNKPVDIYKLVKDRDPAKANFLEKLCNHILGRQRGRVFEHEGDTHDAFSEEERRSVNIVGDRLYEHQTFRVNFTTYDVRRDSDTISPRTHPFVMVRSPETDPKAHPYWYAQVLGVYHAEVSVGDEAAARMEFLWVRWLGDEPGWKSGRKVARLHKIGFVPEADDFAFGFLDPFMVIRGAHLIPSFVDGRTLNLLNTIIATRARRPEESDDWANYYVNIFVDRDMWMRYLGGGIGHSVTDIADLQREAVDPMDEPDDADIEMEDVVRGLIIVEDNEVEDEPEPDVDVDESDPEEEEESADEDGSDDDDDDGDLGYDEF